MGFKDDIEAICTRARIYRKEIIVKLPKAPIHWTQDQLAERFFQLAHLIKENGCEIEKASLNTYKIYAPDDDDSTEEVQSPSGEMVQKA